MHNPVYSQPSTCPRKWHTHKLLWDFDIHTDHLIPARRPDLIIINNKTKKKKRNCKFIDFAIPADHRIKLKECEKKDKYLDLAREFEKTMKHEGDNYINCDWCFWYGNQKNYQRDWRTWKLADELRPSKLQHYWERPEYWEESWRLEETCWHSNSSEIPSPNADMKNSKRVNSNNTFQFVKKSSCQIRLGRRADKSISFPLSTTYDY